MGAARRRSPIRSRRSRPSRTRTSRSARCSPAITSRPPTCPGPICRCISCWRCRSWCCCCSSRRRSSRCPGSRRDLGAIGRNRVLMRFMVALRDPLPGRLCDRDQSRAVRRHAPFHLRAAADRGVAALVADRALDRARSADAGAHAPIAALALYGVAHVGIMAQLHPDEYVYYNAFIGGTRRRAGPLQARLLGQFLCRGGARACSDYLRAEYGADFMDHDFTVAVCGPPGSAAYYFPPNFIFTADRDERRFLHRLHQGRLRQVAAGHARSIASSAWARCSRWCSTAARSSPARVGPACSPAPIDARIRSGHGTPRI